MDMITPPKIPGADRRPLPPRVVVTLVIVLAALGVTAMLFLPPMWSDAAQPEAAQPEPMLTSANAGVPAAVRKSKRLYEPRGAGTPLGLAQRELQAGVRRASREPPLQGRGGARHALCATGGEGGAVSRGRGARRRRGLLRALRASQILGPRRPRPGAAGDPRRGGSVPAHAAELGHPFSTQM